MIGTVHTPEQEANVLHMHRTEMLMFTPIEAHVCLCVTWLLKLSYLNKIWYGLTTFHQILKFKIL